MIRFNVSIVQSYQMAERSTIRALNGKKSENKHGYFFNYFKGLSLKLLGSINRFILFYLF